MARQKKPVHRVQMTEGKRNIIHQLLEEYDIQSAEDIQDALKDLLGGTIKEMMEAEMDDHLGYEKSERSDNDDYRNGYKRKQVNSRYGSMEIEVPQDRKSTFEPQVVQKRQKDISDKSASQDLQLPESPPVPYSHSHIHMARLCQAIRHSSISASLLP